MDNYEITAFHLDDSRSRSIFPIC
ncbi:hypothetical protein FWK35_00030571 [Aphis craccivora]|uniref:Uncharacterized protein n=1 Tax=Aphis craccivora TaxID=307492 RepID=A0A6G0VJQ3_APHCR|nr:hypothetical protein FWK35_00030571 [Aphis craccivora]